MILAVCSVIYTICHSLVGLCEGNERPVSRSKETSTSYFAPFQFKVTFCSFEEQDKQHQHFPGKVSFQNITSIYNDKQVIALLFMSSHKIFDAALRLPVCLPWASCQENILGR
jgi:hypothetical protein